MKLPAADWIRRRGLHALIKALDGRARYVGGAVRDTLLGLPVKDVDVATPLLPEDVMERLSAADIKVVPTGIDHGTVTAVLPDGPVEITTLRKDVTTDGRRATVAFSEDWEEDAARRDFTINALFADPETLEITDYFDGLADLEARHVRFIGSADERIAEDYLRILRYFRFLARFGETQVDEEAFAACQEAAERLSSLSQERVADELLKLLTIDDPRFAVGKMFEAGLFAHILDTVDADAADLLNRLVKREQRHAIAPDPIRRLVALFPKTADKAVEIAKRLRMSNRQRKAISSRVPAQGSNDVNPTPTTIRAIAYWHGWNAARDRALLFGADEDIAAMLDRLEKWVPPKFPLTGGDLIAQGMEPGPQVSETLAKIEREWVTSGFPGRDSVQKIALRLIDQQSK